MPIEDCERRNWLDFLATPGLFNDVSLQLYLALKFSLQDAQRVEKPAKGEKWALRNLSTKEYVRLTISDSPIKAVVAYVETAKLWLPLDIAILCRICWHVPYKHPIDTIPDRWVTPHNELQRGCWAGNRFDIVCNVGLALESWKDETESIMMQATNGIRFLDAHYRGFTVGDRLAKEMNCAAALERMSCHLGRLKVLLGSGRRVP